MKSLEERLAQELAFAAEETRQRYLVREEHRDHAPTEVWRRITDFQREQWLNRARHIMESEQSPMMSATTPRNEAAERLLARISVNTPESNSEYLAMGALLDAALSEERRRTVERISSDASNRIEAGAHALDAFHQAMRVAIQEKEQPR